ncbi:Protein translocase subunit SecA, partial [Cynara cardunculus var. scolymus]
MKTNLGLILLLHRLAFASAPGWPSAALLLPACGLPTPHARVPTPTALCAPLRLPPPPVPLCACASGCVRRSSSRFTNHARRHGAAVRNCSLPLSRVPTGGSLPTGDAATATADRPCDRPSAAALSAPENLGLVTKTWGDFTSLNYWVVRDYYRLVEYVNSFESRIQKLSDEQLTAKTAEFRRRLGKGETLANIEAAALKFLALKFVFLYGIVEVFTLHNDTAEAFAVVREAAKRKLGMRHFDVQVSFSVSYIIGGAVLNDGSIAEMKTGEGKTLVSTLAAYLNALTGEGVHVVTVNDYLAQRDAEWMGRVHRFLGLSVGLIQRGMKAKERRSNYRCDITYTNNSELGFDYLRDNLAGSSGQLVMRWPKPFHFAIVDEVDSVLIDEGRNPLLISGEATTDAARYPVAAKVAELLMRGLHYNIELKDNSVELTEEGIALAEMALETKDLWDENDPWARFVMNALKAKEFYRQDVQYIVKNGKALIINETPFLILLFRKPSTPGSSSSLLWLFFSSSLTRGHVSNLEVLLSFSSQRLHAVPWAFGVNRGISGGGGSGGG